MLLDKIVVCVYFCSLALIGIYNTVRGTKEEQVRPVISSRLLLAMLLFLTSIGGGAAFGITEKTFSSGIAYYYALLISLLADIGLGIFVAPKIAEQSSVRSIGEILEKNYGRAGQILAGICSTAVAIGYIAIQLNVSRKIFKYILNVDDVAGAWASYAIVALYTIGGGLKSVVVSGILQFFLILVAMPLISATCIKAAHPFLQQAVSMKLFVPDLKELVGLSLGFAVMGLDPTFIQRNLLAESPKAATQAVILKSLGCSAFITLAALNGLIARITLPGAEAETALPLLITRYLPAGASSIATIGLFSAIMSTADAALQVAVSALRQDVLFVLPKRLRAFFLPHIKLLALLLGSIGVVISLKFQYAVDVALFVAGCWIPILFVPIVASLYNKYISRRALGWISLASILTFIICEKYPPPFGLKSVFIATATNFALFFLTYKLSSQLKPK